MGGAHYPIGQGSQVVTVNFFRTPCLLGRQPNAYTETANLPATFPAHPGYRDLPRDARSRGTGPDLRTSGCECSATPPHGKGAEGGRQGRRPEVNPVGVPFRRTVDTEISRVMPDREEPDRIFVPQGVSAPPLRRTAKAPRAVDKDVGSEIDPVGAAGMDRPPPRRIAITPIGNRSRPTATAASAEAIHLRIIQPPCSDINSAPRDRMIHSRQRFRGPSGRSARRYIECGDIHRVGRIPWNPLNTENPRGCPPRRRFGGQPWRCTGAAVSLSAGAPGQCDRSAPVGGGSVSSAVSSSSVNSRERMRNRMPSGASRENPLPRPGTTSTVR